MRIALAAIVAVLSILDAFGLDLSLITGVSVKNAVLYVVAGALVLKVIVRGGVPLQMGALQACFATLIGYAVLTMLVDAFVIHLRLYPLLESVVLLKVLLVDGAIVFCVFFYGLRSIDDAKFTIKIIAAAVAFANAVSIADVAGIIKLGVTVIGTNETEAGRVFGAFGHANETAALIVTLIPAYVAVVYTSRGFVRAAWIAAALVSAAMFILTGSRGGFVAVAVGGVWGAVLCHRYLSTRTITQAVAVFVATLVVLVPLATLVGTGLGSTLVERLLAFDSSEGGSGRTIIWRGLLNLMMGSPVAVVTGFGWNSWSAIGPRLIPHNQYLWLWFELGLIGLGSYMGIVWQSLATVRFSIQYSSEETRPYLIAFVFGSCILAVAVLFTQLGKPWPYIWAYMGASCRIAVETMSARRRPERGLRQGAMSESVGIAAQSLAAKRGERRY